MKITNGTVLWEDFKFRHMDIAENSGMITGAFEWGVGKNAVTEGETVINAKDKYIIPGLVDIHIHGAAGIDYCNAMSEDLDRLSRYLAVNGVTSYAPASMTLPIAKLKELFTMTAQYVAKEEALQRRFSEQRKATIRGIYMEGPYLSKEKRGAQAEEHLRLPNYNEFKELFLTSGGMIKVVCVAPELEGALEFIEKASKDCRVSLAHTACDYEQAKAAFAAGAKQLTHIFNGMTPFLHRAPGPIGAAAEDTSIAAEIISDGVHIHESAMRAAFSVFGAFKAKRMVLISDSLSPCGMEEGQFLCGDSRVIPHKGAATLEDGTLAGSATNLYECMRRAISFGIKPEEAIRAASFNPAKVIGEEGWIGSLAIGKRADFIICDKAFRIEQVYMGGQLV